MKASEVIQNITNPATLPHLAVGANIADILTRGPFSLVNLAFFIIGLGFFANLSMAAISYVFSEGSPDKISKVTSRIVTSLIGLTITFTSFVIIRLVLTIIGLGAITPF